MMKRKCARAVTVPVIAVLFGVLLFAGTSDAAQRRKMRLRNYEIQFGTWPLVEITKLSKKPSGPKHGVLNGFMPHALTFQTNIPLGSIQQPFYQPVAGGQQQQQLHPVPYGTQFGGQSLYQATSAVNQIHQSPGNYPTSHVSHAPNTVVFMTGPGPQGYGGSNTNSGPLFNQQQQPQQSPPRYPSFNGNGPSKHKPSGRFPPHGKDHRNPKPGPGYPPQGTYTFNSFQQQQQQQHQQQQPNFPTKVEGPSITLPLSGIKVSLPYASIMSKAAYSGFFGQKSQQQQQQSPSTNTFNSFPAQNNFNPAAAQNTFSSQPNTNGWKFGPPPSSNPHSRVSTPITPPAGVPYYSSSSTKITSSPPQFMNQQQTSSSAYQPSFAPPNSNNNGRPMIFRGPPPVQNSGGFLGSLRGKYGQSGPIPIPIPIPMSSNISPMIFGDVQSTPRLDMDKVPKLPATITVGNHPPPGYKMIHGEQQLITLKLPNTKGRMEPEDLLEGAEYSGKLRREDDPFGVPSITTKTMKTRDKNLPDVGAIYTVNMILQTPNISAPINGSHSVHYQQGMYEMNRMKNEAQQQLGSPLDSQVKLLGKLFTELQRLKPPKVQVESDGQTINSALSRDDQSGGLWLTNGLFSKGSKQSLVKPKIDAPVMAVHIQSYSVPEANSQDPDVLDSVRTFGLPGHQFQFGSTNEIINLMETAQKAESSRIPIEELGNNRRQVNENLQQWVKSYINLTRKINQDAHSKGESVASQSFRQHQMYMPSVQTANDGTRYISHTMEPMDPKVFSHAASITNAGAVATYRG